MPKEVPYRLDDPPSFKVFAVAARKQIWGMAGFGRGDWAGHPKPLTEAEIEFHGASLSQAAVTAITETWRVALTHGCPSADKESLGLDGVSFEFADRRRGGRAWSPSPGSNAYALVELGRQLAAFARSNPAEQAMLEKRLLASADAVRLKFPRGGKQER